VGAIALLLRALNFALFGRTAIGPAKPERLLLLSALGGLCAFLRLLCNSRNCESEGLELWHYLTAHSDRKHCTNDSANSPLLFHSLSQSFFTHTLLLAASQLSAY